MFAIIFLLYVKNKKVFCFIQMILFSPATSNFIISNNVPLIYLFREDSLGGRLPFPAAPRSHLHKHSHICWVLGSSPWAGRIRGLAHGHLSGGNEWRKCCPRQIYTADPGDWPRLNYSQVCFSSLLATTASNMHFLRASWCLQIHFFGGINSSKPLKFGFTVT